MRLVQDWLDAYGESHQDPTNKKIHWVCVPLIMLSLLGLLSMIHIPIFSGFKEYSNVASLLIILVSIYYFRLSIPMGVGMLLISLIMIYIIIKINNFNQMYGVGLIPYIIIFALAWIGQFIGHKIEGKKPAFFKDLQFLLIGPIWLLSFIYNKLNIKF